MEKEQWIVRQVWPDWEITDKLGGGAFGTVYKARRQDLAGTSYAAIKITQIPRDESEMEELRAEGMTPEQTFDYYKEVVRDYSSEIKMMDSVKGYTNIVAIDDYKILYNKEEQAWRILIRMELLTPLMKHMAAAPMDEQAIIRLGVDVCTALDICRKKNIVHRDVKPENIFVNENGVFKLGDFGVARNLDRVTNGMSRKGTPNYMAPEVYTSVLKEADMDAAARVDIYSLGMVLYWLGNGSRLPFLPDDGTVPSAEQRKAAFSRRINGEPLPPPHRVSPALAKVILQACAYQPERRFASAAQMREALLWAQQGGAGPYPADQEAARPIQMQQPIRQQMPPMPVQQQPVPPMPSPQQPVPPMPPQREKKQKPPKEPKPPRQPKQPRGQAPAPVQQESWMNPGTAAPQESWMQPAFTAQQNDFAPWDQPVQTNQRTEQPARGRKSKKNQPQQRDAFDPMPAPMPKEKKKGKAWLWILLGALIAVGAAAFLLWPQLSGLLGLGGQAHAPGFSLTEQELSQRMDDLNEKGWDSLIQPGQIPQTLKDFPLLPTVDLTEGLGGSLTQTPTSENGKARYTVTYTPGTYSDFSMQSATVQGMKNGIPCTVSSLDPDAEALITPPRGEQPGSIAFTGDVLDAITYYAVDTAASAEPQDGLTVRCMRVGSDEGGLRSVSGNAVTVSKNGASLTWRYTNQTEKIHVFSTGSVSSGYYTYDAGSQEFLGIE
ncbi:MAG: serine/threonine protein kinase [Clostridia bacterium]|nr:serine/threonine protein kinase [Clostridia bacterium]